MSKSDRIFLNILTPEKTLLEKYVSKVELPATKGRFMVLWNHIPVITSLESGFVVYEADGKMEKVEIVSGFAEVCNNVVTVCAQV